MKKAWIRIGVTLILLAFCVAASFFFLTQKRVCDTCGEETSDIRFSYEEDGETKYACGDCAREVRKALKEKDITPEDVDLQLPRRIAISAAFVLALAAGLIPALVQLIRAGCTAKTGGGSDTANTEIYDDSDGLTLGPWDYPGPAGPADPPYPPSDSPYPPYPPYSPPEPPHTRGEVKHIPLDDPPISGDPWRKEKSGSDSPASGKLKNTMRGSAGKS